MKMILKKWQIIRLKLKIENEIESECKKEETIKMR